MTTKNRKSAKKSLIKTRKSFKSASKKTFRKKTFRNKTFAKNSILNQPKELWEY